VLLCNHSTYTSCRECKAFHVDRFCSWLRSKRTHLTSSQTGLMSRTPFFAFLLLCTNSTAAAFAPSVSKRSAGATLQAKPQRLSDNVDGVVYVNDKYINCSAYGGFAPDTFTINGSNHIVAKQPESEEQARKAREALVACRVAKIRVENKQERERNTSNQDQWSDSDQSFVEKMSGKSGDESLLFPRQFLDDVPNVYWLGHHNEASFGAIPYLVKADDKWIMVDSPKFSKSSATAVESLTGPNGPDYLLLTQVDDEATVTHGTIEENHIKQERMNSTRLCRNSEAISEESGRIGSGQNCPHSQLCFCVSFYVTKGRSFLHM